MESESQGFVLTFFHYNTRSYPRQETLLLHKFFSGLNFLQNSRAPTLCFTRQPKNMIFSYIINRPPSSTRFHELCESTNMTFSYILHELFWSPYRNECPAKVILYTTILFFRISGQEVFNNVWIRWVCGENTYFWSMSTFFRS